MADNYQREGNGKGKITNSEGILGILF